MLDGTPAEVFRHTDLLLDSNLVPPETVAVRDALKDMGYPLSDDVLTAGRLAEELCPLI